MASATYIQEAANQVRNAIAALEEEVRTIQHEAYAAEAKLKNEAEHEEIEADEDKIRAASAHDQRELKASFEARRAALEHDAKQKLQEVQRQDTAAAQAVAAKNGLISGLRGALSQLERLASAAR